MNFPNNSKHLGKKIGQSEDWKHLRLFATLFKYSDTQLLVELSARKIYLLDY